MQLFYSKDPNGNFGDDLNVHFWEKIWPNYAQSSLADWLVGIGSIFTGNIDSLPGTKLIMGSGYWPRGYGKPDLEACRIGFVRGPLTCRELGLNENLAITDTAALVVDLVNRSPKCDDRVGFMPHQATNGTFNCELLAEMAGVRYIDPSCPVETTLETILQLSALLTEAMHGAIVADALRIPWQRISIFNRKNTSGEAVDFKWQDWGGSLNLDTTPTFEKLLPWPGRSALRRIIKKPYLAWTMKEVAVEMRRAVNRGNYRLSDSVLLDSKVRQLRERINIIKSGQFFRK